MIHPSIIVHLFSGAVLVISVIAILFYFSKIQSFDIYRMLVLLLLLSVAIGTHGISHVLLEKEYNYDPFNLSKINSMQNMECPCMRGMGPGMGKCPFMKS